MWQLPQFLSATWDVLFTAGVPVDFGATLHLQSRFLDASFNQVLQQLFVDLEDSSGNRLTGASFISESGTTYASAIPEPGTAALLLMGLLPIAIAARRRARRFGNCFASGPLFG